MTAASLPMLDAPEVLTDHFRSREGTGELRVPDGETAKGFFRFGQGAIAFGRSTAPVQRRPTDSLHDSLAELRVEQGACVLPFDPAEIVQNLRYERYVAAGQRWLDSSATSFLYYQLRPLLPVSLRKHLQRIYLSGRDKAVFPAWPVDRSVDRILEGVLAASLKATGTERLPFVWFWPRGFSACSILTHDIEAKAGRDSIGQLMDIDDQYRVKASIQVVPEKRYEVSSDFLDAIRGRGFEVNVHGLNHDGNLFQDRSTFLEAASRINEYAAMYKARGFRSPSMYRNADWMQDMAFSYDMSFPSVARLEPQQGGCCTVMPYFLPGGVLELPLTTTQDYSLFHMLGEYSLDLWGRQIQMILEGNGLISFVVHPDYILPGRPQDVYRRLLDRLTSLSVQRNIWMALPGEVEQWWRQRSKMRLESSGTGWRVVGEGSARAAVAFACLDGDRLVYEF